MYPSETLVDHLKTIVHAHVRDVEYRVAAQALLDAGDSAVPLLESLLENRDQVVCHRARELLERIAHRTARPLYAC